MIVILGFTESNAQIEIGTVPPYVRIESDEGGRINGESWALSDSFGKMRLMLYVSPNQQEEVQPLLYRLDSLRIDPNSIEVVFAVNTDAAWIPNFIIENRVKDKAADDTTKTYVLDKNRIIEKYWDLECDAPNILVFNKNCELLFHHYGEIDEAVIQKSLQFITINEGELK